MSLVVASSNSTAVCSMQPAVNDLSLSPIPDYLGYKCAKWCRTKQGGDFENVKVLLHLQMSGKTAMIYNSENASAGARVFPAQGGFVDNTKYCTNHLRVIGLQFIGQIDQVVQALSNYQNSQGFILSGYSGGNRLEYDLEADIYEPRAGQQGCGCKHGMHFYRDINAAVRHYGQVEGLAAKDTPIVSKRLTAGRGLVCEIKDKPNFCQTFGQLEMQEYYQDSQVASTTQKNYHHHLVSFAKKIVANCATDSNVVCSNNNSSSSNSSSSKKMHQTSVGECPICLEDASPSNPLVSLDCHENHQFHKTCVMNYNSCPVCRAPVLQK